MDAILVRDGFALEGRKANLFIATKGVLRTAPNGPRILPGVTRGAAIEAARGWASPSRNGLSGSRRCSPRKKCSSPRRRSDVPARVDRRPDDRERKAWPVVRMLKEALLAEFQGVPA